MDRREKVGRPRGAERRLGSYELLSPVGETALGGLYAGRIAFGSDKGRKVLVRSIKKGVAHDDATLQAIRESAAEVGEIRHPSVTGILEVRLGTSLVIATEHAEGIPLRSLMDASRRRGVALEPAVVVRLVVEILRAMADGTAALEAAGKARPLLGICPDALLVGESGTVVLADLGLLTLGRPPRNPELMAYRAPEQLGSLGEGDPRSELFSVGVIWWELLANRTLFGAENQAAVWKRVRQGSIAPPPGAPDDVRDLVMTLLDRNPDARLRGVDEVMGIIQELGAQQIATFAATTRVIEGLVSHVQRGEFPSMAPPPPGHSAPRRDQPLQPSPRVAREKPSPPRVQSKSAAVVDPPRRPTSSSAMAAARPSSFRPAPLPRDIPDEDDWGTAEQLSDLDLTSLRPSDPAEELSDLELTSLRPADPTEELSDLDLVSLPPGEPPAAVGIPTPASPLGRLASATDPQPTGSSTEVQGDAARKPATGPTAGVPRPAPHPAASDPAVPRPRSETSPVARTPQASMGPLPVSQRPTTELESGALDRMIGEGESVGFGEGAEGSGADPTAAHGAEGSGAEPQDPDDATPSSGQAPLPTFSSREERPVEETLGAVLRDAAAPGDRPELGAADSFDASGSDRQLGVDPDATPLAVPDHLPAPRSPMESDVDEPARISGLEHMAEGVREQRQPVSMPAPGVEPVPGAKGASSVGVFAVLFVVACFAASSLASYFGLRAVLLAPGDDHAQAPAAPADLPAAKTSEPAPEIAASSPVAPEVSETASASAQAPPEPPPSASAPPPATPAPSPRVPPPAPRDPVEPASPPAPRPTEASAPPQDRPAPVDDAPPPPEAPEAPSQDPYD